MVIKRYKNGELIYYVWDKTCYMPEPEVFKHKKDNLKLGIVVFKEEPKEILMCDAILNYINFGECATLSLFVHEEGKEELFSYSFEFPFEPIQDNNGNDVKLWRREELKQAQIEDIISGKYVKKIGRQKNSTIYAAYNINKKQKLKSILELIEDEKC